MICLFHQHHRLTKPLPSQSDIDELLSRIARNTYTFHFPYVSLASIYPENFECHLLCIVSTLPNFGDGRDVLREFSLLHDALEFVHRWDGMMAAAQTAKFDDSLPLRL